MPLVEDAKAIVEHATGIARPGPRAVRALVKRRKPSRFRFKDDGHTPNNPSLPLLVYRSAVKLEGGYDPAAVFEDLFASNGWKDSWRNGIYDFLHFHTMTHEVLGIARGSARVQFGGQKGRAIEIKAGDVIVLPAGTGHRRLRKSRDLLVVGAYPSGGTYDEPEPDEIDQEEAAAAIAKVKLPAKDPVYGMEGPLKTIWKQKR